jgi:predicted nucleic acid-binding protein
MTAEKRILSMKKERSYFADTSFLIDLARENKKAVKLFSKSENIITGSICIFELGRKLEFNIDQINANTIIDFRPDDAEKAYKLYRKQLSEGEMVNNIDYLIAAQAINLQKPLLTADKDFKKIKEVEPRFYRET